MTQAIQTLIAAGESLTLELKKSTAEKNRACRSLCALANGQGGQVVFGVTPAGKVLGQKVTDHTLEELAQEFQGFEPPLTPHLTRIAVATIFKELELIEKYGSGVRRVIDAFVAYGLPEPEFEATQGGMAVTVFKALNGGVNTESAHFLQLIQAQPGIKTSELVGQTGKPQRTVERWLKQLKDSQTIEFRGAPKTGGYYPKAS
jgi:predicted HTH transcriptional regulator